MANIANHHSDKSGVLTQVRFANSGSNAGDHLGTVMAGGEGAAHYHDWVNEGGIGVAVFKGNLNAQQQQAVEAVGGVVSYTTSTEWSSRRRTATGQQAQQGSGPSNPDIGYAVQYE
jgi:hypothetical protein